MKIQAVVVYSCLGGIFGAPVANQDALINDYIKSQDLISSPSRGFLRGILANLGDYSDVPFSPEDYAIIKPQLSDPDVLRALLVEKHVLFDTYGLSISPEESEEALLTMAEQVKKSIALRIKDAVNHKTKLPTKKEAVTRIRSTIDSLSRVYDLESELITSVRASLDAHPENAQYMNLLIEALPTSFDHEVMNYLRLFFSEANAYDIDVADKLRNVFEKIQIEYKVFPDAYYKKLVAAIARPGSSYTSNL